MSVFKFLILTAARLKYNVEEALLLPLLKGTRAQRERETEREGERERERQLLCNVRKREGERRGEMEKRGGRDSAIFDDNFVAMHSQLLELEAALKHSLPWKKKYRTTCDCSLFFLFRSSLCSLT